MNDLDIVALSPWDPSAGVVIRDPNGVQLVVPLTQVRDNDDETFKQTLEAGAWATLEGALIQSPGLKVVGRLERRWVKSGPRRV